MKGIFIIFIILFLGVGLINDGIAEETAPETARFQWGGSVELGYRFTDIDGSRNRYKEVVNLSDGLRLFDLTHWGKDLERKGLVDAFSFRLNGIGDPFPFGRLQIKKEKAYDLVATYREYKYFFDREDDPGLLTDNHDFHQKRRRGGVTLGLFPKEDVRVNLGYSHTRRDGDARAPRALVNAPPNHEQDLEERLNEYFVSGDFSVANCDLHVKQSFWSFDNRNSIRESSTRQEKRDENVNTYVTTLKGHRQLGDRWDLDAGYVYAHSNGRGQLFSTFPAGASGDSEFNFNTHIVELGLSHLFRKELILHLDYRFHRFDQDGRSTAETLVAPQDTRTTYDLNAHTVTAQVEYIPRENLNLRAGYRFQYRDIDSENTFPGAPHDGGEHSDETRSGFHGWVGSVDWKPYKFLSFYADYQGSDFDSPYTRISPDSENIAKIRAKFDPPPLKGLTLKGTVLWKRRTNPNQDYRIDVQDYTLFAGYQPAFAPNLSLDASFTYEKIQDSKDIHTPPLVNTFTPFSFDSDAFIYSGGIGYEGIYKGLGARLYGSYARTRKENSQKYADGVISFWYKNRWVTPIVTLERTYLHDHERRHDSFAANLITLSLRKEF